VLCQYSVSKLMQYSLYIRNMSRSRYRKLNLLTIHTVHLSSRKFSSNAWLIEYFKMRTVCPAVDQVLCYLATKMLMTVVGNISKIGVFSDTGCCLDKTGGNGNFWREIVPESSAERWAVRWQKMWSSATVLWLTHNRSPRAPVSATVVTTPSASATSARRAKTAGSDGYGTTCSATAQTPAKRSA